MADLSFDIIVFGATSFVGQIMTRYMSEKFSDGSVSWAIAGRSEQKLKTLREEVGLADLEIIVADAKDEAALAALCARTKVVISTVGPYALYGDDLVKACAVSGTHYCDLSGEPQWIRKMQRQHAAAAKSSGARIVHCCGFDSIPFDLGVHFLQKAARDATGQPLGHIKTRVVKMKGGPSGGTVASIINMIKEAATDADLRQQLKDPYSLCPPDHNFSARQPNVGVAYDDDYGSWTAPFIMAAINTRIVHRSNALSGAAYGDAFLYEEAVVTGKGGRGKRMARATKWGMGGFMVALVVPPVRWALEKFVLPKPGEGPSEAEQLDGEFDVVFMGETDAGVMMQARVTGDRDPGYGSTAKMLAQAAACLAQDIPDEIPGGFWTPATLMGDALIPRLRDHAGLTFEIE
jgi:short subunit dehydrogenase-like uncharacterized protein